MGIANIGLNVGQIDSPDPTFTVGTRGAVDSTTGSGVGVKEYLYVKLTASTAYTVGQVVLIDADGVALPSTITLTAPGQAAGRQIGIVVTASASTTAARYAWVQIYGETMILANDTAALNTPLQATANAGEVDDPATAGTEELCGVFLTTTATSDAAFPGFVTYPYVGRTY